LREFFKAGISSDNDPIANALRQFHGESTWGPKPALYDAIQMTDP